MLIFDKSIILGDFDGSREGYFNYQGLPYKFEVIEKKDSRIFICKSNIGSFSLEERGSDIDLIALEEITSVKFNILRTNQELNAANFLEVDYIMLEYLC